MSKLVGVLALGLMVGLLGGATATKMFLERKSPYALEVERQTALHSSRYFMHPLGDECDFSGHCEMEEVPILLRLLILFETRGDQNGSACLEHLNPVLDEAQAKGNAGVVAYAHTEVEKAIAEMKAGGRTPRFLPLVHRP